MSRVDTSTHPRRGFGGSPLRLASAPATPGYPRSFVYAGCRRRGSQWAPVVSKQPCSAGHRRRGRCRDSGIKDPDANMATDGSRTFSKGAVKLSTVGEPSIVEAAQKTGALDSRSVSHPFSSLWSVARHAAEAVGGIGGQGDGVTKRVTSRVRDNAAEQLFDCQRLETCFARRSTHLCRSLDLPFIRYPSLWKGSVDYSSVSSFLR